MFLFKGHRSRSNSQEETNEEEIWGTNQPEPDPPYYDVLRPTSTCDVCSKGLSSDYVIGKYWSQKYCTSHINDGTPHCCSCNRMEPRDKKYTSLDDVRKLCLECLDSALMSTKECKPLLEDLQIFYEGLNMKVRIDFPILLVQRSELNGAVTEENAHNLQKLPEVKGIVRSLLFPPIRPPLSRENMSSGIGREPFKLFSQRAEVTTICVLFGYPRLGYPASLPLELEEGIAQVMAYRWLKAELDAGNGGYHHWSSKATLSPFEKHLGNFLKQSLLDSQDPVYGEGFRVALRAVDRHGLRNTLAHIRTYGMLP